MDPKIIGPGIWFIIHHKASKAITLETKLEFIQFIKELSIEFPCVVCSEHMIEYIKNHPFDSFMDITVDDRDIGMFKWSWIFHNNVNTRLRKSYMDWNTAYKIYLSSDL